MGQPGPLRTRDIDGYAPPVKRERALTLEEGTALLLLVVILMTVAGTML